MMSVKEESTGGSDEKDILRSFRGNVTPMSSRAYAQGFARATDGREVRAKTRRHSYRTVLAAAAAVVVLAVGIQMSQEMSAPTEALAATVLDRASAVAATKPPLELHRDGWVYREILRQNGESSSKVQVWESADGSSQSRTTVTEDGAEYTTALPLVDESILAFRSLRGLAELTEDPEQLLSELRGDPATQADIASNGVSADVALWDQVRGLSERMPVQRQWVLFQAAKAIGGLKVESGVQDATGRTGTALGLDDPRLGTVQLIFSVDDGRFLGERIVQRDSGTTQFSSSVTTTDMVAAVGEVPPR